METTRRVPSPIRLSALNFKRPNDDEPSCTEYSNILESQAQDLAHSQSHETWWKLSWWILLNVVATIGIVFLNKAIFNVAVLRQAQLSFAAFHFALTVLTLYIISRPLFGLFVTKRAPIMRMLPLSIVMCFQVILPNLGLAYSTVLFYQMTRVLVTPGVAASNYILYRLTISRAAALSLVPVCLGVALMTYNDNKRPSGTSTGSAGKVAESNNDKVTTLGIMFCLAGVCASSLYIVWVGHYHKKLQMGSLQLLQNQAPLSVLILLYAIPWLDSVPNFTTVDTHMWILIVLSGFCACAINVSQFFIINQTGGVASTVVGHTKTCAIVALGWWISGREIRDWSVFGIVMAISGIITYSIINVKEEKSLARQEQNG